MRILFLLLMIFYVQPSLVLAKHNCQGDSAKYRLLPELIGRENTSRTIPIALPCDSMIVPRNQITTIFNGSLLYFKKVSLDNQINVQGRLVAKGNSNLPIYFAGSLVDSGFLAQPGNGAWGNILVAQEASLELHHTQFWNAPTPLILNSRKVLFDKVYFKGCIAFIEPSVKTHNLDSKGEWINYFDYQKNVNVTQTINPPKNDSSKAPGFWSAGKIAWSIAGAAAIMGGSYYALMDKSADAKNSPPIINKVTDVDDQNSDPSILGNSTKRP